ncbi:unnamed protein product [Paramecium octaurelia]|uniref:Uncharacterized protein n=1 Tax=Paramecium octaurelia TaxID=43137 RepID=A0A8S1T2G6_PAROT|nr:unnamed protein product [Paramecium octaurelia]
MKIDKNNFIYLIQSRSLEIQDEYQQLVYLKYLPQSVFQEVSCKVDSASLGL